MDGYDYDRNRRILAEEGAILTMIARDAPFLETLTAVIGLAERMAPGSVAGVTIVDRPQRALEMALFTGLDRTFSDAIAGVPLDAADTGTCTRAIFQGEPVTSEDLEQETRFSPEWVTLCTEHGLRSVRSQPVHNAEGIPLGAFVLCFRQPRHASQFDDVLLTVCAKLTELTLEQRRVRERHELIIAELEHRTRNLFAAIGSLARFSFKNRPDDAGNLAAFDARLNALAVAHSLMLADHGADLETLIRQVLEPYARGNLIRLTGPAIELASDSAVALSIAAHELATNAVKYGALSNGSGRLDIAWDVVIRAGGDAWLSIDWVETGGPAVTPPTRHGFGMLALERLLAREIDGHVQLEFVPQGLRCSIAAPFSDRIGARS